MLHVALNGANDYILNGLFHCQNNLPCLQANKNYILKNYVTLKNFTINSYKAKELSSSVGHVSHAVLPCCYIHVRLFTSTSTKR